MDRYDFVDYEHSKRTSIDDNRHVRKVYKGPFSKEEATKLAEEINGMVRKRCGRKAKGYCVCTAACGAGLGHNSDRYDVYIFNKTTNEQRSKAE